MSSFGLFHELAGAFPLGESPMEKYPGNPGNQATNGAGGYKV